MSLESIARLIGDNEKLKSENKKLRETIVALIEQVEKLKKTDAIRNTDNQ